MKDLIEYTEHSMTSLNEYLKESLLDDLDDLENDSDNAVAKAESIGTEWSITYIEDHMVVTQKLDRKKLKELAAKSPYNQTKFTAYKGPYKGQSKKTSCKSESMLCNIILSLDKSSMVDGEYTDAKQNNDIYNTFDVLTQDHFTRLHKLALHFSKDAKRETFSVTIEKSLIVGYKYIIVDVGDSGHYVKICLKKKE